MKEALELAREHIAGNYTVSAEEALAAIDKALAQPEQEPVAWPCVIETADFEEDTVTLKMQSKNYSVGVGLHWLSTTPPQRTWVGLTDEEAEKIYKDSSTFGEMMRMVEARLKEKNT